MIKECKVCDRNKGLGILLVEYEGEEIQINGVIPDNQNSVYVKFENKMGILVNKPVGKDENKKNNVAAKIAAKDK